MNQLKSFFMANKVFILGLLASLAVVIHQFVGVATLDWKVIGYAALMATCSYIANTWRGQGMSILGIVGTLAGTFVTVQQTGNFTWNQFILSAVAAVLAMVAPPPKSTDYEKTNVIANAKQGFSTTANIDSVEKDKK